MGQYASSQRLFLWNAGAVILKPPTQQRNASSAASKQTGALATSKPVAWCKHAAPDAPILLSCCSSRPRFCVKSPRPASRQDLSSPPGKTSRRGPPYARARTRPSDRASAASVSPSKRQSTSCGRGVDELVARLARRRGGRYAGRRWEAVTGSSRRPGLHEDWRWDSHGAEWCSSRVAAGYRKIFFANARTPWRGTLFIHTSLTGVVRPSHAVDVVPLLVAAGNDINAQMPFLPRRHVPTPLCWCLTAQQEDDGPTDSHFRASGSSRGATCSWLITST